MKKITITIAIVAVAAAAALVSFSVQQPTYAQLVKDPGGSGFAPSEQPLAAGWMPQEAPNDAPGHLKAELPVPQPPVPTCDNCAKDFAPGNQALLAGGIGQSQ